MNTVRTANTRLMRQGDTCVYVNNVDMKPEYHITTGKEYPGVIDSVGIDSNVECSISNDLGEPATHNVGYGSFAGGYSDVKAILPREEYIARVNALHAENISNLLKQATLDITAANSLKDKMLELANVTAPV